MIESPDDDGDPNRADDEAEERFERARVHAVLVGLGAHHRAALTLRYLDGLPVPEVAAAQVEPPAALPFRVRRIVPPLPTTQPVLASVK